MINIKKRGDLPIVDFVCPFCGCEFTADSDDYIIDKLTRFKLDKGRYVAIAYIAECPCCDERLVKTEA